MMKTAVLFISLQFGSPPQRSERSDGWGGADKAKHFFMGAFTQSFGHGVVRLAGGGNDVAIGVASAGTAGVALWKEWRDASTKGVASGWDVAWTMGGGAAASAALVRSR